MKEYKPVSEIFSNEMGQAMNAKQRVAMTVAAEFVVDKLPRVKNAGKTKTVGGKKYLIMHDGSLMLQSGYVGDWMDQIIMQLKGHHEPQEEIAFHEVLKRIDSKQPTMIELGAYWAYYSVWFCRTLKNARAFAFEPNKPFLNIGKQNIETNKVQVHIEQAAAGIKDDEVVNHPANPAKNAKTLIKTVDTIVRENKIDSVDILHMDIQGAELDALESASKTIKSGKVRFLFISTHHHSISNEPRMHEKCIEFVQKHNGHIVCDHSIYESFSGDGLIVASFDKRDKDFSIELPINRASQALFTTPEHNIERFAGLYEEMRADIMHLQSELNPGLKSSAKQLARASRAFAKKRYSKNKRSGK